MVRRVVLLISAYAIALNGGFASAQAVEAPQLSSHSAKSAAHIDLGQSIIPLYGPWKFQLGDSPVDPATHNPLFAESGFDDSAWETVDLSPVKGAHGPIMGDSGYVAGWTAKGHPGYWGYAWYRIRIDMNVSRNARLALAGPSDFDDAYQVFLNGASLGSFGDFNNSRPVTYFNQPMTFALPQADEISANGSSSAVIAFRVWMEPNTLVTTGNAGGFHTAPLLGEAEAVAANQKLRWLDLLRSYSPFAVEAFLFSVLAIVAFSLLLFDRSDKVYLWMGSVFLLTAIYSALGAIAVWTRHLSIFADALIVQSLLVPLAYAGWVMVWWMWFGLQRPAWLPKAGACLAALYILSNTIGQELFFAFIPHPVARVFEIVSILVRLLFFALLLWIAIQGIRRQGPEGWPVLPAILLLGIGMFQAEFAYLNIQLNWFPFGMRITLAEIGNLLLLTAALGLLLLRRVLLSVHRQRLMAEDLKRSLLQSDFVAAVSHEFRSPLTTLRSITELLVQDRILDDTRRRQSYAFLDRETARLHRLVEDLLDFGRMESGRKQYRIEPHDAFRLVRDELAEFTEQAEANGFHVQQELSSSVNSPSPPIVLVDEEAFRRAVRNLLDNAMKYSPVCRTVWVEGAIRERQVMISVSDKGMGIGPAEEQAIFQKFVRGQEAKKAGIKGTGIGLAMVRQISQAMGGDVHLKSEVGSGSTFTIVLPLAGQ